MATSQPYRSTVIIATIWDLLMCGAAVVIAVSLPSTQLAHAIYLRAIGLALLGLILLNAIFSIPRIHLDSRRRGYRYSMYKSIVYGLSDFPYLPLGGFSFYRSELKHRIAVGNIGPLPMTHNSTARDSLLLFGVLFSILLICLGLIFQFDFFQATQPVSLTWNNIQITLEIMLYLIGGVGLFVNLAWTVLSKRKNISQY